MARVQKVQRVRPSLLLSHRLRGEGGTQYPRGPRPQVSEGSKGKVLKMDGPSAQGFLSLTGPLAPRVVVAADAADLRKGARLSPRVV